MGNESSSKNIEEEELEDENSVKPGSYIAGKKAGAASSNADKSLMSEKTITEPNETFILNADQQQTAQDKRFRPKSQLSDNKASDHSKYSAVVFTVPMEQ